MLRTLRIVLVYLNILPKEEVKEYKYFDFMLKKNWELNKHLRERKRKATMAMKKAWSIEVRIFSGGSVFRKNSRAVCSRASFRAFNVR